MLKKKVDGLEEYYYQWMNKYKDDADRRGELLKRVPEWVYDKDQECYFCEICGNNKDYGHSKSCELAKELADE